MGPGGKMAEAGCDHRSVWGLKVCRWPGAKARAAETGSAGALLLSAALHRFDDAGADPCT